MTTAAGEVIHGAALPNYPPFDLTSSAFHLARPPKTVRLKANARGIRLAERLGGVGLEADLLSDRGVRGRWRAELRDGSNYIRQTLNLSVAEKHVTLFAAELCDVRVAEAATVGVCPAVRSPATACFSALKYPGRKTR